MLLQVQTPGQESIKGQFSRKEEWPEARTPGLRHFHGWCRLPSASLSYHCQELSPTKQKGREQTDCGSGQGSAWIYLVYTMWAPLLRSKSTSEGVKSCVHLGVCSRLSLQTHPASASCRRGKAPHWWRSKGRARASILAPLAFARSDSRASRTSSVIEKMEGLM